MTDEKSTPEQRRKLQLDNKLDDELEQTFPAGQRRYRSPKAGLCLRALNLVATRS